jgi:hypothetical protein
MELIIGAITGTTLSLVWQLGALVRARVRDSTRRSRRH